MPGKKRRSFTGAFKQAVVARTASADSIRGLAAEPNMDSRILYRWHDRFQAGGLEALAVLVVRRSVTRRCQGPTARDGRAWRDTIYAAIHATMEPQGGLGIERIACRPA